MVDHQKQSNLRELNKEYSRLKTLAHTIEPQHLDLIMDRIQLFDLYYVFELHYKKHDIMDYNQP